MKWPNILINTSIWRILLPPLLTTMLFVLTIFVLILPAIKDNLLDHKREMINELVTSTVNNVGYFEEMERSGKVSRQEAQRLAMEQIRALRFGPGNQDYFWINDLVPTMIMHPYRPDLEGDNLSSFSDPHGKHLFSEMVEVVEQHGEGFVDYMWQLNANPDIVVPKISYVKEFQPWGWIIGTGIYIEDVQAEIATLTRHLVWICLCILTLVALLGTLTAHQGIVARLRWRRAEEEAHQHLIRLSQLSRLNTMKVMATQIAHEIDQPLSTILLRTSLCADLLREGKAVTDEVIESLDEISEQVERASRIVKRVRNFSNRSEMVKERADLNLVISAILDFVEVDTRHSNVNVVFNSGKATTAAIDPIWVFVDTTLIEQVVMNIVRNAIEALGDNPRDGRCIFVRTEVVDESAMVEIRDNGPGIAADRIESIFDSLVTSKITGLGIGLSISRSIIEEHGGRLWAEAEIDKGGLFRFTLPYVL